MIPAQIPPAHRERLAYVYVRQSTQLQVRYHQESTERQYHLRERAIELGWPPSAVEIIDEDQGRSGRSATYRTGFQRLVAHVSLGQVGIVLMLEASRLARNNSDWYQLIEICGLRGTLIADEGAIYDPRDPNDRLLLGMKGTLSEAELFTLRTRLAEGRWNKARKGLLHFPLPVGYVRGADGGWELDPDAQVCARLDYLFAAFRRLGGARAVVRDLRREGLELPVRVTSTEGYGTLVWKQPTLSAVVRILSNPAYAGTYVYGRWDYTSERHSPQTGKVLPHLRPEGEWPVCIQGHHPAYISWAEYEQNRAQLRANWPRDGQLGVTREGGALLQGLLWCGVCGQKMMVQHHAAAEQRSATYLCDRAYRDGAERICQSMTARPVDQAVTEAFFEAVSPLGLALAARMVDQIEETLTAQRQQHELQLEQARYEARLAQARYEAVDPVNRLVAAELERRWNEKLERVGQLEHAFAQAAAAAQWQITAEERAAIDSLAQDLPALWQAATTTNQERKHLLRCAIEAVDVDGLARPGWITVQIHWRSGTISLLEVARPKPGDGSLKMPPEAVALIEALAPTHSYEAIAQALQAGGWRTAFGRAFTSQHVGYVCRRHGWGRRTGRARVPELDSGHPTAADHGHVARS